MPSLILEYPPLLDLEDGGSRAARNSLGSVRGGYPKPYASNVLLIATANIVVAPNALPLLLQAIFGAGTTSATTRYGSQVMRKNRDLYCITCESVRIDVEELLRAL